VELDIDEVDETDGGTEVAPNQRTASARPGRLSRL
jgi:hypothetical protein